MASLPLSLLNLILLATITGGTTSISGSPVSYHSNPCSIIDTIPVADKPIFEAVEKEASFPGGPQKWNEFLAANLNGNVPIENRAPVGTYVVQIQFVVGKDGSLQDIKLLTNHGYGMEDEVLRVIKKSPKWIPAVQKGRNVMAYRKQPVTFSVEREKKKRRRDS